MDNCKIVFVNAVPNMKPIDICIEGQCIIENLHFSNVTEFLIGVSGNYLIEVYLSGYSHNDEHKLWSEIINLSKSKIYSYSIIGTNNFVEGHLIGINNNNLSESDVTFVNYSPYESVFNILLKNETDIVKDCTVKFKHRSNIIKLNPDKYTIQVVEYATNETLKIENFKIDIGQFIIFYLVGFLTYSPEINCIHANYFNNAIFST